MILVAAALVASLAVVVDASPLERRTPTTPISSITAQQWAALNASVEGRLYQGVPWARSCFPTAGQGVAGSYDLATCFATQQNYKNDSFIADNFGAYQNSNWGECQRTGAECLLDYNLPQNPLATLQTCQQGSVPNYYVQVAKYQDVQAVFAFAKRYGVPLTVKNSGHDYRGRSSGPGTLGIWTHHFTGITRNKAFVPAGCPATKTYDAVTVGAGNGFLSLYQFAEANNITLIGGSSETVGPSGGWISGGGHSSLSNTLGLGVDRVRQFTVVTPDGQYRTVSACQNPDLWFALRGGGGSTFGVIMSTTFEAAPKVTLQCAYVKFASVDLNSVQKFLTVLVGQAQKWAAEGWGGYIEPGAITSQTSGFVLVTPLLNNSAATASMQPVKDYISSLGQVPINFEVTEQPSFLTAYNKYLVPNEELVNLGVAVASRLIPKTNFNPGANANALVTALTNAAKNVGTNIATSGGLAYGGAPFQILVTTPINYPNAPDSAVTPAWRNALWHVLFAPTFNYNTPSSTISAMWSKASTSADFVRAITPGSGAYQNEADIHEPNYQQSFWGAANYARLVKLKQQYDPSSLLQCWQCIGWSSADASNLNRYSCYP